MEVQRSDLEKVLDAVSAAVAHHVPRDDSNAALHLASSTRYSPLTSELMSAKQRLTDLLAEDSS